MRRTKEEAAVTRQNILSAAEELFVQEGFDGASLDRIAEAAGVKRGAVHFHFTNKLGILVALASRETQPLIDLAAQVEAGADVDPLPALASLIVETLQGFAANPRRLAILRAMILADLKLDPDDPDREALLGFDSRTYGAELAILTAAEKAGRLAPPWTAATATAVFHSFMCGVCSAWTVKGARHLKMPDGIAAIRQLAVSFGAR